MFVYNTTIKITADIHQQWLRWLHDQHIPRLLATGKFTGHQLLRLREIDDTDGPTYALQLFIESKADYNAFKKLHEPAIVDGRQGIWGEKMFCFGTLMEIVH